MKLSVWKLLSHKLESSSFSPKNLLAKQFLGGSLECQILRCQLLQILSDPLINIIKMHVMLWKWSGLIDFNLRRENFNNFSSVNVSNQDGSLPGSEIFHCPGGSKAYIQAKMNVFFHFQNSKYPILPVKHLIFDN